MRTILLAAGFGTRLQPLTNTIPKCLVPIHGKPLLEIWLERLTECGIGPFLINTHYLTDQVNSFIEKSIYRDQVTLVHENELYGTAGTLIANLDFVGEEDVLLIHADNYCLADFHAFIKAHINRPPECIMTMMTFRTDNPSACGIVELDKWGIVSKFHEKVKSFHGNLANGAVYILSYELIMMFRNELKSVNDFSTEVLNHFVGRINTYETTNLFLDIGTPEAYARANK